MNLEPSDTPHVNNPSETEIADAIRNEKNEFVILSSEHGFIQTSGGAIEYSESVAATGEQRQFRGVKDHPSEKIFALFCAYNRGDQSYKTAIEWEDITAELERGMPRWQIAIVVAVMAAIAAVVIFFQIHKK